VEAVEFRQGWSVSARRGRQKEEKETTKEGGLSPQEGDVRRFQKKLESRRQENGSAKERFRVSSTKKFLFLVHEYLGSERPVSFEYRLLRDLVYEEAMCEGSSDNGLPYTAKVVPTKDYFTHPVSKSSTIRTTLRGLKIPLRM
jgi:hypothetical protein